MFFKVITIVNNSLVLSWLYSHFVHPVEFDAGVSIVGDLLILSQQCVTVISNEPKLV